MEKNTQTNSTVTTSDVETQSAQKFPTNSELLAKIKKYRSSSDEIITKGAEIPTKGNAMFPDTSRRPVDVVSGKVKGVDSDKVLPPTVSESDEEIVAHGR